MPGKFFLPFRAVIALALAVLFVPAQAVSPSETALDHSVKQVAELPAAGKINPKLPYIIRRILTATEGSQSLNFNVALKMRNLAELQARVASGEHISQMEMAAKYQPAPADYDATVNWLLEQGFTVTRRDSHHMAIFAQGSVKQIAQALKVAFARVKQDDVEYSSAITAPIIPAALAKNLVGINGLQPQIRAHKHLRTRAAQPNAASGSGEYTPAQVAQAYGVNGLYTSKVYGAGQSIAIVIDTFPSTTDLALFWQNAGVAQSMSNIQFIQAVDGALPAPSGEETLDVEWSSGMAPDAQVRVYATTSLGDAELDAGYQQVLDDVTNHPELGIRQMSMSYGIGEKDTTLSQVQTDSQFYVQLAAAGVTIFASSGDDGSSPNSGFFGGNNGPVQAESPASDPYVTGVGGTTLQLDGSNNISSEVVWSNSIGATGGGTSIYFDRPVWQTGPGVSGTKRMVPDVAATADPQFGAITYFEGSKLIIGGTSWSSPLWAGLCALINQTRQNAGQDPLGVLGPHIYPLMGTPSTYSSTFRDITSGNNASPTSSGLYNAGSNYDETTGMGSPKMLPLAQNLLGALTLSGIKAPVASQLVTPGQNATFASPAQGGSVSYQWQIRPAGSSTWSDLGIDATYSGSTSASLTVSGTTLAMSGDQFRCVVTLPGGTITPTLASVLIVDNPYLVAVLAGNPGLTGTTNGSGLAARFNYPSGLAVDSAGNVFVADFDNNQIRKITPLGVVSTPYGSTTGASGSANGGGNSARFNQPNGVAVDSSNNLYVADTGNNTIRMITSSGVVSTFPGAAGAGLSSPEGLAVDGSGNVYVADTGRNRIRKITPAGVVTTIAGQNGVAGFADDSDPLQALFNGPTAVAVDNSGNVFVADYYNSVVREITPSGVITVAGIPKVAGYRDGDGASALFNGPVGLTIDGTGNLYVADALIPPSGSNASGNCVIRKIASNGTVSTLAGTPGVKGNAVGNAHSAKFYSPQGIALSSSGKLYIADTYNQMVQQADLSVPVKTIALSGSLAFGSVPINTTPTATLKIRNQGNTALTVSSIDFPAGFTGSFVGTIAGGSFVNVTVTFSPTSTTSYGGTVTVHSDADNGDVTTTASGDGIVPPVRAISLSGTLAFGGVTVNTTASRVLTITNTGNADMTVSSITFPTGFTGDWTSGIIPANSSQGIRVIFSPVLVTNYGGNIIVSSNASSGGNTISATGNGLAAPAAPVAKTSKATNVGAQSATLAGAATPKGSATTAYFQYGITTSYGLTSSSVNVGSGTAAVNYTAPVSALAPKTTYHFRAVAQSAGGTVFGSDSSFTTLAAPVIAAGTAATSGGTGAGVSASLNPNGTSTTYYFQYGTTTSYTSQTASQTSKSKTAITVFGNIGDLPANTTYHYRLVATSSAGTFFGPDQTFTTPPFATTTVALVGDTATGTTGRFATLGNPAIDDFDGVAFAATLTTGGAISTTNNAGIWADAAGTRQLVARSGTGSAPGSGSATFATLGDPVYNGDEEVAFRGLLRVTAGQATSTTAIGVWSTSGGSLALVARQGSQAPDCATGVTFADFTALALPDQGGAIFLGTLTANSALGVTTATNMGIWAGNSQADAQLLVRLGDSPTGKAITKLTFLPTPAVVPGQSRGFAPGTGDFVYAATFSDNTTGLLKSVGGVSQSLATMTDSVAGVSGAQFSAFGSPAINNADHTAFASTLATGPGGVSTTNNFGIWADDSGGTRQLIARTGITIAPGTNNATFSALSDPAYNSNHAVAFRGTLRVVTGQATSTTASGIWANNSGSLTLIARQGSQAPDCPTGATFALFTALSLPDQGGVLFLGTLNANTTAGVTTANNTGIWAVDTGGTLQLIARTGDTLHGKTITTLTFLPALTNVAGQARSFSQGTGDIAYLATFSDKTTGIFKVIFP